MNENISKSKSIVGYEICKKCNDASKRKYAEIYKRVKSSILYEKTYLDALLNTRIIHMFYNDEFIQKMYMKYRLYQ